MKTLNGGNVLRVALDEITVEPRLRLVREAQVENLIAMAEDTGITTPIHLRKVPGGYVLIDGAHRLEAARRMGLTEIAAIVVECRADEARAMEASNNLGAARMTPLQTAVFVASWKKTYYELHPERKPGVFKGNQHSGKVVSPENGLTTAIADAFGRKRASIYKIIAVGEKLTEAEVRALDEAERAVSLEDLEAIGKIKDPEERGDVVRKLALGAAKTVRQARAQIAVERGGEAAVQAPVKDAADAQYQALLTAWTRAGMRARKRFLFEMTREVWHAQNAGPALHHWANAPDAIPVLPASIAAVPSQVEPEGDAA